MGNKQSLSMLQNDDSRSQIGVWSGWLAPGILDKGEFAIYKQLGIPRGKIIQSAMTHLTQNEIQFMHAGRGRNIKAIRWYLSQGLSANTLDENRTSILHIACRDGSLQIIEELITKGANINIADVGGWTALHISSHCGRSKVCQLLLTKNADAFAKTNRFETPYDLAKNEDTKYVFDMYWKERENVEDTKMPSLRVNKFEQAKYRMTVSMSKLPQMNDPDIFPVNITPGRPRSPLATGYRPSSSFPEEEEYINPLMETACLRVTETARVVDQSRGVSIFNISPLKGISYLILTGIVDNDPSEVAELLHLVKELSPFGIGQILGCQEYGYDAVAKFYMGQLSLEHMDVIEALEQLLANIAIPQNGQMVDQILTTFAEAYWQQNGDSLQPQAIQRLAKSIIDLDNSLQGNAGSCTSQSSFISTHASERNSAFEEEFLRNVYQKVAHNSVRTLHQQPSRQSLRLAGSISGILELRWKRRWKPGFYVLCDHFLYHFDSDMQETPSHFIPLDRLFLIRKDTCSFMLRAREDKANVLLIKLGENGSVRLKFAREYVFRSHEIKKWCKSL